MHTPPPSPCQTAPGGSAEDGKSMPQLPSATARRPPAAPHKPKHNNTRKHPSTTPAPRNLPLLDGHQHQTRHASEKERRQMKVRESRKPRYIHGLHNTNTNTHANKNTLPITAHTRAMPPPMNHGSPKLYVAVPTFGGGLPSSTFWFFSFASLLSFRGHPSAPPSNYNTIAHTPLLLFSSSPLSRPCVPWFFF